MLLLAGVMEGLSFAGKLIGPGHWWMSPDSKMQMVLLVLLAISLYFVGKRFLIQFSSHRFQDINFMDSIVADVGYFY